jgi:crotonobetainyl-CoA:carnitine CoA-transferase CaiB-like acyl-CoA transferase
MMNRNKRGIALDLKTDGGKEVLPRLIAAADVLVENFGPGVMERLGFGYEVVHKRYPALIYCSLSGFGRTGPYRHRRGFDLVAQAMSGIMSFTGERSDGPPVKCGAPLSDITAGILAAMGILAAYAHRLKTGQGQWVETSLFEAALVQAYWQSAIALATGTAPRAMGSAHPLNAPYQAFEALRRLARGRRSQSDELVAAARRLAGPRACARRALSHERRSHGPPRCTLGRTRETFSHPTHQGLARKARAGGPSMRPRP